MRIIDASSIGEAQNQIVALLVNEGTRIGTEDNESTLDMMEPVCIHIENPVNQPMVSPCSKFGPNFTKQYENVLYTLKIRTYDKSDPTYTYGNRLTDYPVWKPAYKVVGKRNWVKRAIGNILSKYGYVHVDVENLEYIFGDGHTIGRGINQIQESIIQRLAKDLNSRRALAITWVPTLDLDSKEPPCLQIVWCRVDTHRRLHIFTLFRSNDMLSAVGQNLYAITALQTYILTELNLLLKEAGLPPVTRGSLENVSLSPHMYDKRDGWELEAYLDHLKLTDYYRQKNAQ